MSYDLCFYSCRTGNCDRNLTSNSPLDNYQRQKIIQNTVRTASSNYTMNLGALSVYQKPAQCWYNVNWNQLSDRAIPHRQPIAIGNGSSTKGSITRIRPGALSPGGYGVDVKHDSYARYLARIKGKGPLRREVLPIFPPTPIQGGKIMKTTIVSGCDCLDKNNANNDILYENFIRSELNVAMFDGSECQVPLPTNCQCIPTVKLITNYLTNCPSSEIIYVL